ncbi:uncharacterized protein LOC110239284 [Exaiptasia diaphana]|uniref:Folate receptor-like domain-containing protein n=1 Tax=Exaiptasia diaphana TaxID=2652724 RepID=A0A913X9U6_EXADI|nr:uncharacterized protein LOC110239284 [Exaiptasia diaphana]
MSSCQEERVADLPLENYCPYFKNRAPEPQPDLRNCTWYREKSCCLSKELDIILEDIPPPTGANQKCLKMLNYLMCFVCAPNQNVFYKDERLTVCIDFCNELFDACGNAYLKGSKIRDFYLSGTDFCLSRKFKVSAEKDVCYSPYNEDESSASSTQINVLFLMLGTVIVTGL